MRAGFGVRLSDSPRSGRHCNSMGREPHEGVEIRLARAREAGDIGFARGFSPMGELMPSTFCKLLYHIVFSTKRREPLITPALRDELYPYIAGVVRGAGRAPAGNRGNGRPSSRCRPIRSRRFGIGDCSFREGEFLQVGQRTARWCGTIWVAEGLRRFYRQRLAIGRRAKICARPRGAPS